MKGIVEMPPIDFSGPPDIRQLGLFFVIASFFWIRGWLFHRKTRELIRDWGKPVPRWVCWLCGEFDASYTVDPVTILFQVPQVIMSVLVLIAYMVFPTAVLLECFLGGSFFLYVGILYYARKRSRRHTARMKAYIRRNAIATWPTSLHEKALPGPFVAGYLQAFADILEVSQLRAYYSWIAAELFTDETAKITWLTTMYRYFEPETPQPLNYTFVSFIHCILLKDDSLDDTRVMSLTKKVGSLWWGGGAPILSQYDHDSLRTLLAPAIEEHLNRVKCGSSHSQSSAVNSFHKLAYIGLETFVTELYEQSGIELLLHRTQTYVVLDIIDCPFCASQSHLCYVLWGIVEGFVGWLHGRNQPYAIPSVFELDKDASTGHIIALRDVQGEIPSSLPYRDVLS